MFFQFVKHFVNGFYRAYKDWFAICRLVESKTLSTFEQFFFCELGRFLRRAAVVTLEASQNLSHFIWFAFYPTERIVTTDNVVNRRHQWWRGFPLEVRVIGENGFSSAPMAPRVKSVEFQF